MDWDAEDRWYRCILCDMLFFSPEEADRCCKSAKTQVLCASLRETLGGEALEQECNAIRAHIFGNYSRACKWG